VLGNCGTDARDVKAASRFIRYALTLIGTERRGVGQQEHGMKPGRRFGDWGWRSFAKSRTGIQDFSED
jgi:hypothetical protein